MMIRRKAPSPVPTVNLSLTAALATIKSLRPVVTKFLPSVATKLTGADWGCFILFLISINPLYWGYLEQSLDICQDIGDMAGLCKTLFNMGHIYWQNEDEQESVNAWISVFQYRQ